MNVPLEQFCVTTGLGGATNMDTDPRVEGSGWEWPTGEVELCTGDVLTFRASWCTPWEGEWTYSVVMAVVTCGEFTEVLKGVVTNAEGCRRT